MDEREFVTGAQDLLHSEFFAELEQQVEVQVHLREDPLQILFAKNVQ